ncbi:NAD(P)H-dependent glycerol-3-phosphate dehydrogenase [Candidatus Uhrbacteria bacterium]|nr:NAD(P)H-dependent glycerol-3-phosphate dehydrogenase [Candidatus Uhrbacteria bacterium]
MASMITILGAGNMGTALATVLAANGHRVTLWSIEKEVVADIVQHHRTEKYLPGIVLSPAITATTDLATALARTRGVLVAVPSSVIEDVAELVAPDLPERVPMLSVAKGIDVATFRSLPEVIAAACGRRRGMVAGLAGPAVATEFAQGSPTAVVVAGAPGVTRFWVRMLRRPMFHVEESRDLLGVSWAACLKNVYAVVLGMADGMGFSMNTKALLTTHALREMATFLARVPARQGTVYGLAGLGDLVTTGFSPHGRNRRFGELICAGAQCDIPAVLKTMTVEGVAAVQVARAWARKRRLRLPLLELVGRVCHQGADPTGALRKYLGVGKPS